MATILRRSLGISIEAVAGDIVEYVKDMAMVPPGSSALSSYNLRTGGTIMEGTRITEEASVSTREAFSLTATDMEGGGRGQQRKRTFHNPHSIWSTALSEGFEAPHGCQVMLDTLEVRPRSNVHVDDEDGADLLEFEVVLHPPSQFMKQAAVDSSAFNKHCALSLLMGLAVHPSVQTVEVGQQIELASVMPTGVLTSTTATFAMCRSAPARTATAPLAGRFPTARSCTTTTRSAIVPRGRRGMSEVVARTR